MQMAINSSSCPYILVHSIEVVGSMVLDNMVLVHSNVALVGSKDHSKNRDRSSSLLKKEPQQP
jgi:hypothetical protein